MASSIRAGSTSGFRLSRMCNAPHLPGRAERRLLLGGAPVLAAGPLQQRRSKCAAQAYASEGHAVSSASTVCCMHAAAPALA